jgi:hypothetical protein
MELAAIVELPDDAALRKDSPVHTAPRAPPPMTRRLSMAAPCAVKASRGCVPNCSPRQGTTTSVEKAQPASYSASVFVAARSVAKLSRRW